MGITAHRNAHTIQEEGSALPDRANLNFIGAGQVAEDDLANDATKITLSDSSAINRTTKR